MKLIVNNDKLICTDKENINAKTVNWYDIEIEFSSDWNNLTKKMVYISDDGTAIENAILDGVSTIPNIDSGIYSVGVVGLKIENNKVTKRIGTNLLQISIIPSGAEYNGSEITDEQARTYDKYLADITAKAIEINADLVQIANDLIQIETDKVEIESLKDETKGYKEQAQDFVSAITFSTFEINDSMELLINAPEKLGNATFEINGDGELEVGYNGEN